MQRNEQMYHHCLQHTGRHVKADMHDDQTFYGFVEQVDVENVYLIVLESDHGNDHYHGNHGHGHGYGQDYRIFGGFSGGYGYGPGYGYGGGPGYGRPRWNWQRVVLPLTALAAISLLY